MRPQITAARLADSAFALEAARAYLQDNAALRAALGIAGAVPLEPQALGEGEHNKNYRFVDPASMRTYVLRINVVPQPFHSNQVAYEYAALQTLEVSGCTPVPLYLDASHGYFELGAMVIGFCEGRELDFDRLGPNDLHHAVALMADVHSVPVPDTCPIHRPRDPLQELFDECLDRFAFYRASGFEDARITAWVDRFVAATLKALEAECVTNDCVHIINTETLPSHFLIPEEAAQGCAAHVAVTTAAPCAGVARASRGDGCDRGDGNGFADVGSAKKGNGTGFFVDWERPIIGEVAQDLAFFVAPTTTFWDSECLFPRERIEEVLDAYWQCVDGRFDRGNFDARFRAYLAVSVLRAIAWCCRAHAKLGANPGMHMTPKAREKFTIYLSDEFLEFIYRECFEASSFR